MNSKLLFSMVALLVAAALLAAGLAIGSLVKSDFERAVYPGSRPTADRAAASMEPDLYYTRKDFYVTQDSIYDVYRWYTVKQGLSLRSSWKRDCLTLSTKNVRYGIEYSMQVIICDALGERMIVLERTLKFSWP